MSDQVLDYGRTCAIRNALGVSAPNGSNEQIRENSNDLRRLKTANRNYQPQGGYSTAAPSCFLHVPGPQLIQGCEVSFHPS